MQHDPMQYARPLLTVVGLAFLVMVLPSWLVLTLIGVISCLALLQPFPVVKPFNFDYPDEDSTTRFILGLIPGIFLTIITVLGFIWGIALLSGCECTLNEALKGTW